MIEIDFSRLIGPVARKLFGEQNAELSSPNELRFGSHGSLKVQVGGDNAGTYYDHEAKRGGGVMDMIQHHTGRINGEALDWIRSEIGADAIPERQAQQSRRKPLSIVATYDYHDEQGSLQYQVVRCQPKDFRQRRPDPTGRDGWTWKVRGMERFPYRLPQLVASPAGTTVYIAEGEKDCDALHALDLVATCNPGGAGRWMRAFGRWLCDRDVVVLPDNDAAGESHAADVACKLRGAARSLRILRLPDLPPKGDVSDWLASGGTAEKLRELVGLVPEGPAAGNPDEPAAGQEDVKAPWKRKGRAPRSAGVSAFRKGKALVRDGATFEQMVQTLRADPETAAWMVEKDDAGDDGELRRIFDAAFVKGPLIRISGGELHKECDSAEAALIDAGVAIFQRGKVLVRPAVQEVPASRGRTARSASLVEVTAPSLIDNLCRVSHYEKYDSRRQEWMEINPPRAIADTILAREGEWPFPRIAGVITTPTLRSDGSVLVEAAYDPATRLYHLADPDLKLHPAVFNPNRQYAVMALNVLSELLAEFPFVDGVSKAVALSGIITPVVRGCLSVAPLHAFKAHTAGTGKSYLTDVASAISTGQPCPVVSAAPDDEKETEKRITGLLLAGYPICSLDNVNGELGGDLLCQAVERPLVRVRALGSSVLFEIESKATWFATGNNLRVRGDMVRRTIISSLDAGVERPELREFKSDPVGEVLANRSRYVSACLTIVRAYIEAGCPNQLKPIASFEDWSGIVRSALVWLGCADPASSMEAAREDDPELAELREFLGVWIGALGTEPYAVKEVVQMVGLKEETKSSEPTDYQHPDLHELLHRMFGERGGLNVKRLGKWLARFEGKITSGLRIKRALMDGHVKVQRWQVEAAKC